jgi:hypothetical protein
MGMTRSLPVLVNNGKPQQGSEEAESITVRDPLQHIGPTEMRALEEAMQSQSQPQRCLQTPRLWLYRSTVTRPAASHHNECVLFHFESPSDCALDAQQTDAWGYFTYDEADDASHRAQIASLLWDIASKDRESGWFTYRMLQWMCASRANSEHAALKWRECKGDVRLFVDTLPPPNSGATSQPRPH